MKRSKKAGTLVVEGPPHPHIIVRKDIHGSSGVFLAEDNVKKAGLAIVLTNGAQYLFPEGSKYRFANRSGVNMIEVVVGDVLQLCAPLQHLISAHGPVFTFRDSGWKK